MRYSLIALACTICITTLTACTTLEPVYIAAGSDIVTTGIGLSRGAVELNPLGFAGTTVGKVYYLEYIRPDLDPVVRDRYDRWTTSIWGGAAVNNAIQILVPGIGLSSVILGFISGVYIWDSW